MAGNTQAAVEWQRQGPVRSAKKCRAYGTVGRVLEIRSPSVSGPEDRHVYRNRQEDSTRSVGLTREVVGPTDTCQSYGPGVAFRTGFYRRAGPTDLRQKIQSQVISQTRRQGRFGGLEIVRNAHQRGSVVAQAVIIQSENYAEVDQKLPERI